jgi:DNA-binding transcriptional MerR regulator
MTIRAAAEVTIQQVSHQTGLSELALRYYERIGLIEGVSRDERGHRRYGEDPVATLQALACLRAARMSVEDMRRYLSLLGRGDDAAAEQHDLFARHA